MRYPKWSSVARAAAIFAAALLIIDPTAAGRAALSPPTAGACAAQTAAHVAAAGPFTRLYNPTTGDQIWYINDHTIVSGEDGTWHLFGITHAEPADPEHEIYFAHATAPSLHGPWTKQSFALALDPALGETHLWAPYVLRSGDLWYMFYAAGGPDHTAAQISLATSPDLSHWTRSRDSPLFRDGYDARDPFVMRLGKKWVMYYTATSDPAGGHHVVAYRTSTDLLHWGPRHIAYTDPATGTVGGRTESPYIAHHDNLYYLFIGPRPGYVGTAVFASADPLHFTPAQRVGHVAAHALEVVRDTDGSWWVSSAGWAQGGVQLAPLKWNKSAASHTATTCATLGTGDVSRGSYLVNYPDRPTTPATVDDAGGRAASHLGRPSQ